MRSIVARWRPGPGSPPPGSERVAGVPLLRVTLELPLPVALPLLARPGAGASLLRAGILRPAGVGMSRPRLSLWAGTGAVAVAGGGRRDERGERHPVDRFATAMRRGVFLFVPLGGPRALAREWRIHRLALRCRDLLVPSFR